METIASFHGEYRWLSNFWPCTIEYNGLTFPSVENAYQASKTNSTADMMKFLSVTPGRAKSLGRNIRLRSSWDTEKLQIMEALLRQKFKNELLKAQLKLTGNAQLIEGNHWHDRFWGQCPVGNGENHLGKLLMKIREEISK